MKQGVRCHKTGDVNGTDTSSTNQSTGARVGKINSQTALDRHGGRRASLAIGNVQPASTCKICCVGGAIEHRLIEKRGSRWPHYSYCHRLPMRSLYLLAHIMFAEEAQRYAGNYYDCAISIMASTDPSPYEKPNHLSMKSMH